MAYPWEGVSGLDGRGAEDVRIEVIRQPEGLHGGREVWVRVLSNEVLDLPRVLDKMNAEDRAEVDGMRLVQGYIHHPQGDELSDHDYPFEDWWVFDEETNPNPYRMGPGRA